jgi:hypothetical protein
MGGPAAHRNTSMDIPAIGVSVATGVACLLQLPVRLAARVGVSVAYVPLYGFLLFSYALIFVCSAFGDCL